MVDDILDITATTEELGKTAGKDLAVAKATYPSLVGLERSREVRGGVAAPAGVGSSPGEGDWGAPAVQRQPS